MTTQGVHPLLLRNAEEVGTFRIVRRLATGGFGADETMYSLPSRVIQLRDQRSLSAASR